MSDLLKLRAAAIALAAAVTVGIGTETARADTATIDLPSGASGSLQCTALIEDRFQVPGSLLFTSSIGTPPDAISLDGPTPELTLTRVGGGSFPVDSFDYRCSFVCNFSAGGTAITGLAVPNFTTLFPSVPTDITSFLFSRNSNTHQIDTIVVSFEAR